MTSMINEAGADASLWALERDRYFCFRTVSSSDECLFKTTFLITGVLIQQFLIAVFVSLLLLSWFVFALRGLSPADFDFICWGVLTPSNLPVGLFCL